MLGRLAFIGLGFAATTGVLETDIYPLIEYWRAGDFRSNPLCEGYNGAPQPISTAPVYPFRRSLGLKELARKALAGGRSRGSTPTGKSPSWNQLLEFSAGKALQGGSFREIMCELLTQGLGPETFCTALGNFTRDSLCMTEYHYRNPSEVIRELSPQNNFGFKAIPAKCLRVTSGSNPVDLLLKQHPSTPSVIPLGTSKPEGPVYHLAYRAIDLLNRYAEWTYLMAHAEMSNQRESDEAIRQDEQRLRDSGQLGFYELFQDHNVFQQVLPGFQVRRVFFTNEPKFRGGPTLRLPYAVLAAKDGDLLVVLRDAVTSYDGRLAMTNQQALRYLYNFTGEVHEGATSVYQTLSGATEYLVQLFYDELTKSQWPRHTQLTVVGANLPSSAVAVVLATHLATALRSHLGHSKVIVNSITFGTPYLTDKEFVEMAARTVEIRHITFGEDVTDLFPCPTTYSCDEKVLPPRTGLETGIIYRYQRMPGLVPLSLELLSEWRGAAPLELQFAALRDCGYACALSRAYCPEDPNREYCDPQKCAALVTG